MSHLRLSRRRLLAGTVSAGIWNTLPARATVPATRPAGARRALIAVTLDLEMSRHYPTWDQTHWDYEKGNLDESTKRYTVEFCRRVQAHGGRVLCFVLGRTLEQENVDWLKEIARAGHPLGNHTYDHVNVKARSPEDLQHRFRRSPWLIHDKRPEVVIRENIRMTDLAVHERLGARTAGFRAPGGYAEGLADRPDLQRMLLDLGFKWVSSQYPAPPMGPPGTRPDKTILNGIVAAQARAQPFRYDSGLIEIPMSPPSDIHAFREARWKLPWFLEAIRAGVEWAIEHRCVYDFIAHPSCLGVVDPEFKTLDLIGDLVRSAGERASLADLNAVADHVPRADGS